MGLELSRAGRCGIVKEADECHEGSARLMKVKSAIMKAKHTVVG